MSAHTETTSESTPFGGDPDRDTDGPGRRRNPVGWLVVCCLPAVLLVAGAFWRRWMSDDGYIYLRVVDMVLAGEGPVFNPGHRVEACTSTAWLALLTVLRQLGFALEWSAIVAGLGSAAVAMVTPAVAGWRSQGGSPPIPLGLVAFAGLTVAWDFTTSGLETPLVLAWLAVTYSAVGRVAAGDGDWRRPAWFVAGLGVLVRPELALYTAGWFTALALVDDADSRRWWRRLPPLLAIGVALPVAWQVFRMGFYGALVPNTAIAKSAAAVEWVRGWAYLGDFVRHYHVALALPALVLSWSVFRSRGRARLVAVATVAAALVHGLYVVRVGGDYMHGRMWLPVWFALLLPVAVVPWPRKAGARALVVAAVVAALAPAVFPMENRSSDDTGLVVNERQYWLSVYDTDHPIVIDELRGPPVVAIARDASRVAAAACAERPCTTVLFHWEEGRLIPATRNTHPDTGVVFNLPAIGAVSLLAGREAFVIDRFGLADAVLARTGVPFQERAGHSRRASTLWRASWYLDDVGPLGVSDRWNAARDAHDCGLLRELHAATTDPLTLARFWRNIVWSGRLTRFRFPHHPVEARTALCGDS